MIYHLSSNGVTKKKRIWYPRCKLTGKVRYPNQRIAYECMLKFMSKGEADPGLHVYREQCEGCNGWHLGSSTNSLGRKMSSNNRRSWSD